VAIACFQKALALDPEHQESAINLARAQAESRRADESDTTEAAVPGAEARPGGSERRATDLRREVGGITPETDPAPLRVLVFSSEPRASACAHLRLIAPLRRLRPRIEIHWARRGDVFDTSGVEDADIIVFQRLFPSAGTADLCRRILQGNVPVLYELDDDFWHVPENHPHRNAIACFKPYILECLGRADAVTVSTQELATRLRSLARAVHVLPNTVDTKMWEHVLRRTAMRDDGSAEVVIGFAGTPTHRADLDIVSEALVRIRKRYGDRVRFRFLGCPPPAGIRSEAEFATFDLSYSAYARALAYAGFDIALAPLVDDTFNRCKSDIKWLEYSACGFAGVYSDLPVYRDSVRDGESGLLVENSTDAWFEAIDRLVRDAALRERIGQAARAQVMATRTVETVAPRYLEVYRRVARSPKQRDGNNPHLSAEYEIWKGRHALTDARRRWWEARASEARMPVHMVVAAHGAAPPALSETLASLARQIAPPTSILVVGEGARPPDLAGEIPYRCAAPGGELELLRDIACSCGDAAWLGVVDAGDILAEEALAACLACVGGNSRWSVLYTDEDFLDHGGRRANPLFKPDFNPDLLRATFYTGHLWLARAGLITDPALTSAPLPALAYSLLFRAWERGGDGAIGHVARVLYHRAVGNARRANTPEVYAECRAALVAHLGRTGERAVVEDGPYAGSWTVRYRRLGEPCVSIIIPTCDCGAMLEDCVESILGRTAYPNYEILVVDNGSTEYEALEYLRSLESRERVRVIRYPHEYNYSAINNHAARLAGGEYLVLLNNDTVVLRPDWLERMLEHAQRPDIGAVGVRLVFTDHTIQHAGVVLGLLGSADHIGYQEPLSAPGYMGRAQLEQNFSAVTAACLMVRTERYWEVGGLDEAGFRVLFNDVDLCLKLGRAGYRILWTPRVTLVHHGSASLSDRKKADRARAEKESLWAAWLPKLARDPAYHRNLSLVSPGWGLETEVDVPWEPDLPGPPRVLGFGAGSEGVLEHRLQIPLRALDTAGHAECALVPTRAGRARVPTVVELERSGADVVLLHNAIHDAQIEALRTYRHVTHTLRVFGQDDLMLELPGKNPLSKTLYRDIEARLRLALSYCDRLIVTTEPLADAYRGMIGDIRVVPNYLSRAVWGALRSERRRGRKPRVGWAGAQQHTGDLEILREVVKRTADEVEWVFFGMSLHEFRRYWKELHSAVSFEEYPSTLAALDLDLAVAPLEQNRFNEAKSPLRILEYGALGWPVVCTDIEPYRDAPVCRVPNRARAWIEAIRERVHDLDAAAAQGDRLREWVQVHGMLEDHLDQWLSALHPGGGAALTPRAATLGGGAPDAATAPRPGAVSR
jgi:GT2 family glycosyltransferase/glycosyltransferase involved in cell wall biosynthesis